MRGKWKLNTENKMILAVLFLVMAVSFFWCVKKSDMFIDEICTYGLANSYYAPFINDISEDADLVDKVLTQEDIKEYLTVSGEDAFKFNSVYYNQTQDTQPPLHYLLLHFGCSIFQESYSKWIGLSINLILYLITNILLYKISIMILGSRKLSALAVLIYGLSYGGLSTVLMIRMYMLLTFLTMCFAYAALKLYQGDKNKWYYPAITLILFCGMFTQYFFVWFAFFFSAIYFLRELKSGRWKDAMIYALFAFLGIGIFYGTYPCVIDQLFADKLVSGKTAVENVMDIPGMLLSIYSFFMQMAASYKAACFLLVAAVAAGMFKLRENINLYITKFDIKDSSCIALIAAVIFSVLFTAVVSPVTALRYIYNILPLAALFFVYFIKLVSVNQKKYFGIATAICGILCVGRSLYTEPEYVENVPKENYDIVEAYSDLPCVYLNANEKASLTQDMLQLIEFKEVYITNNFVSEKTKNYLEKMDTSEGIILYIDVSEEWGSGFDSEKICNEIAENTEFETCELLCSFSFSETYLLR
ncbi:MAG: glycosyltransferase family 39 protein [Clostridiales bacterium]|nr:glycosyltransferase family 39 protein [Clostridiales bacterium]